MNIARQVYGDHTQWSGIQLARLRLLAEKIIEVHEASKSVKSEALNKQDQ